MAATEEEEIKAIFSGPLIVPYRHPMHQGDVPSGTAWRLTRIWILFFEQLARAIVVLRRRAAQPVPPAAAGLRTGIRTLVLKDTAIGDDIADHVTAYLAGTGVRIVGVLRLAISSDLTVRVNKNGAPFIVATIPAATAVDDPVEETGFTDPAVADGDIFSWDVLASDGSADLAGVATFTLEWRELSIGTAAAAGAAGTTVSPLPVTVATV